MVSPASTFPPNPFHRPWPKPRFFMPSKTLACSRIRTRVSTLFATIWPWVSNNKHWNIKRCKVEQNIYDLLFIYYFCCICQFNFNHDVECTSKIVTLKSTIFFTIYLLFQVSINLIFNKVLFKSRNDNTGWLSVIYIILWRSVYKASLLIHKVKLSFTICVPM